MTQAFAVQCLCGWKGMTRHSKLKPHHRCPECRGAIMHRPANAAEMAALKERWMASA